MQQAGKRHRRVVSVTCAKKKKLKFAVSAPGLQDFTVTIISATHVLKT